MLVLLALVNSTLAVSIARRRSPRGSGSRWVARARCPRRSERPPEIPDAVDSAAPADAFMLVVGLAVGNILGPDKIWFWIGIVITLSVV